MPKWIQSFSVPSSSGHGHYTVILAADGTYGCSCPHWKFRGRQACKHIEAIKKQAAENRIRTAQQHAIPVCRPANVSEVQKLNEEVILVPLLPLDNTHFLATVIVDLLMHGIPFDELQRQYHLPKSHSRSSYIEHIQHHGRCIYGDNTPTTDERPILITTIWNLPEPILPRETPVLYQRRTGCPSDLYHLALNAIPIQSRQRRLSTPPSHPSNRRRILTAEHPPQPSK